MGGLRLRLEVAEGAGTDQRSVVRTADEEDSVGVSVVPLVVVFRPRGEAGLRVPIAVGAAGEAPGEDHRMPDRRE